MTASTRRRFPGLALLAVALACACALAWIAHAPVGVEATLRAHHATLLDWQAAAPAAFLCAFFVVFVLVSALTLPGGTPLCLLAGSLFGTVTASVVLGLASTVGALLPFLFARHLARERAERVFGHRLRQVEHLLAAGGGLRLFWLRVVPLIPFPVLNPLLGLSRLSLQRFFWPSLAGLTVTSVPYAWAGQSLGDWMLGDAGWWPLAGAVVSVLLLLLLVRRAGARDGAGTPA